MKTTTRGIAISALVLGLLAASAHAQGGKPLKRCAPDAAVAGTVCIDKYEGSVWRVPNPTTSNRALVRAIQEGEATAADLIAHGATQLGVASDDYAPCSDSGEGCTDGIYAVSLPSADPSRYITWFQAQAACANARKRLPSNAEWQAAVAGTPDPGPDNGTTDCNSDSSAKVPTGSRSDCVSATGAFDMVGNLEEWVAEWVPRANASGEWSPWASPTGDEQAFAGAATDDEPGGLLRGSFSNRQEDVGPMAINASSPPSNDAGDNGFRCAR
jgi:formylglycine-generating enzyme required for sulfatase activity